MKKRLAATALALTAQLAVAQEALEPPIDRDPRFMDKVLRAVREAGGTVEGGRFFLEQRGFGCTAKEGEVFFEDSGRGDFVHCHRELDRSRIEVALYHEGRRFLRSGMKVTPKQ